MREAGKSWRKPSVRLYVQPTTLHGKLGNGSLMLASPLALRLDSILLSGASLNDVLKSTPPLFDRRIWTIRTSLKAQFSFAFHLSANRTWCSGEDKQCLSPLNAETSRQKRLACGRAGRHVGREGDIKGFMLSGRRRCRQMDMQEELKKKKKVYLLYMCKHSP